MELLAGKIDAGNAIAIGAVAQLALGGIEPVAGLDLLGAIDMILRRGGCCEHRADGQDHDSNGHAPRLIRVSHVKPQNMNQNAPMTA